MRCNEIMKTEIECVSPNDAIERIARRMRDAGVGFLPICDNAGHVLGTVTDRDLVVRALAEQLPPSTPVQKIMSREVVACQPGDDVVTAQERMARHHKSRIVCLDQDEVIVGVISLSDIAQHVPGPHPADTLKKVSEREVRP